MRSFHCSRDDISFYLGSSMSLPWTYQPQAGKENTNFSSFRYNSDEKSEALELTLRCINVVACRPEWVFYHWGISLLGILNHEIYLFSFLKTFLWIPPFAGMTGWINLESSIYQIPPTKRKCVFYLRFSVLLNGTYLYD